MATQNHAVVIAGGGPTGLMLAGELALAGINVAIVERRASHELAGLRAGGLHMRTLEVLDQRGLAERFVAQGQPYGKAPFAQGTLDISDTPTRYNYFLALWQTFIERGLAAWVGELGVLLYRGCEVQQLAQDDSGVDVALSDGRALRAQYLVGCDGGRSVVRKQAGIDFPGWDPSTSYLIAEIALTEEPAWGLRHNQQGMFAIAKMEEAGHARVVLSEAQVVRGEPTLEEVRARLITGFGSDYGLRSASYISRFTDMARQAARYREKRVFLAGDAAHVHSPMGGQGLNVSVQDAVNLGWKLAQVIRGTAPDSLLDTYHTERHPVGARLLRNTMALTAIERTDDRAGALRGMLTELMQHDATRRHYVAMMSGLDLRYDCGQGHPLLGRRMPDLDLSTTDGPQRVYSLLHAARPVLLNLGVPSALDIASAAWRDRVGRVDAQYVGAWELPGLGAVAAPTAVLIRPDGYVAWVGEDSGEGLRDALSRWFGPAAAA
ncbi:MAG: FAD-dependent monooxygenase [Polyangiales bacterium]